MRVLQELIAVSWHDAEVAKVIRAGIMGWIELIVGLARAAEQKIGPLGPFSAEEVGAIAASSFIGGESLFLLGPGEEGLADPRIAASRRRPHPDCGRILIRQEVTPCAQNCRTGRVWSPATA